MDFLKASGIRSRAYGKKFVSDIFETEERPESKKLIKKIKFFVPKVPLQRNDTNCGKFVLYYISLFLESAPETFSIAEGYPYFMKKDWFTPDQLESFWQKLQTETRDSSEDSAFSDGSFSGSQGMSAEPALRDEDASSGSGEDLNMLDGQSKHQTVTPNLGHRKATGDATVDSMLEIATTSKMSEATIMRNEERFAISKCIKVLDEMQGVDQSIYFFCIGFI
ncbi:uncharacterized protein LOC132065613 isoform X3 [Lycium ferocissimum]|uniref:uncharacterized protein LOC132065613 isoform X3 n=1 Tax=Lycium ferocissimum TaxID=112874 RepID=UPI0028155A24|nr:uncharacterized protein LOC132065613 isoform X3 [Lycium ferocissimum]